MQIEHLLNATSSPLLGVLGDRGRGYYVPMYQRRYRWTAAKISRLLQDMMRGLDRILTDQDALTFVGTLICSVKDPTENLGREASKTLAIIDGQQRLTTFCLICIACDDEILRRWEANPIPDGAGYAPWLEGQMHRVRDDLWQCLCEDTRHRSDAVYRYRPRIIRSGDDVWGVTSAEAEYASPLPRIVMDYVQWREQRESQSFIFRPEDHAERYPELSDQYRTFQRRFRDEVRKRLRNAIDDDDEDLTFPTWRQFRDSREWLGGLFESDTPDAEATEELLEHASSDNNFGSLVRLVIFSRFLVDRSVMTLVEAQREDYALDMFDSLNTTGEPLTALETFKPRVIQGEGGIGGYRASESWTHLESVEKYLAKEGPEQEPTVAKSIVTLFALAETGRKLGGNLSEQRNYLRETYDEVVEQRQARRAMTRQLERSSALYLLVWDKTPEVRDNRLTGELALPSDTLLCLDVLRKSQHEIVQGLLSRYYDSIISQQSTEARDRFIGAVRAVLGFWILWRASSDGTAGIDNVHRDLMSRGSPPDGEQRLVAPLARVYGNELPSPERLCEALRERLSTVRGISDRESFVQNAQEVPIGKASNLARFMVLMAHHGRTDSAEWPGLTIGARDSPESNLLDLNAWNDDRRYATLEHIAPLQPKDDENVDEALYIGERYHLLGNLTALPVGLNAVMSNRSWSAKRVGFRALCAGDPEGAERVLSEAPDVFSPDTVDVIANESAVIPTLRPLLHVDVWGRDVVEERSRHMLDNVWQHAGAWLGFDVSREQ